MFTSKHTMIRLTVFISIISGIAFATQYHKPDLFPIGFSGIGNTGYDRWSTPPSNNGSPYYDDADYGTWAKEVELLELTHCNFIGCSDGAKSVYISLRPNAGDTLNFYHQVCLKANSAIYLAPMNTYCPIYRDHNANDTLDTLTGPDTVYDRCGNPIILDSDDVLKDYAVPRNERWGTIYRHYWPCGRSGEGQPDSFWHKMADSAATCYDIYFDSTGVEDSLFWGYNPFVEDPAVYRGSDAWHRFDKNITLNYNLFKTQTL